MFNNDNAMTVSQNTQMAPFVLPDMVESEFSQEDMADDMEGMSLSLNRVKIPAGGGLQMEIPTDDPDAPKYVSSLVGVILHNHTTCAYWIETDDDGDNDDKLPVCSSLDGKTGIGTPGGACATCALNTYGTAAKGKGKACKNMRVLYILCSGEYLPLQLNLPPTSIKPYKEFVNKAFRLRNRASWGSVVEIKLKKENNGKQDYSVATFRRLYDFQGPDLAKVRAYANNFKNQIQLLNDQRAQAANEHYEEFCQVEGGNALPMAVEDGVPFVINGDREALPG